MIPNITVSTEVKAMVERVAKAFCAERKVANDTFNQDANAITVARCLKELKVLDWDNLDDIDRAKVLQVLKKGGNSSALRQAIMDETGKKKSDAVVADMASLV